MGYTFVLVHGSWHDNRAWRPVIDRLEQQGQKVYAPTIAGHAPKDRKDVTHADCVRSVVDFIKASDVRDFILVGHSFGGTVIQPVAEHVPDRIRRLVFWNAFVLQTGESLVDVIPPPYRELFAQLSSQTKDRTVMLPWEVWRSAFMQLGSEEAARQAYAQLTPEPMSVFEAKLDQTRFFALGVPRSYIRCREDVSLPPGEYAWYPRFGDRLGKHKLVEAEGCHEACFTHPVEIADAILEASRDPLRAAATLVLGCLQAGLLLRDAFEVPGRGGVSDAARQEIVPGEPRRNLNDVSGLAELLDCLAENDFH